MQQTCAENGRWKNLPWVYLTYAERNAWGELGWSEQWWDRAWGGDSSSARTASGRCFGGQFIIGESGTDTCLIGELIYSYDVCQLASANYSQAFPGDLFPLKGTVVDLQGTPGCHIQDRVGFQFNEAQITGRNQGYSPVCKFNATLLGGCPGTTTTTLAPLPNGMTEAQAIPSAVLSCYQDLTRDQQDAVRLLGYTIESWHSCMVPEWNPPTCEWPADIPKPTDPCLQRLDYLNDKYDVTKPWNDLSYRSKQALVDLGWDSAGSAWASQTTPESYAKPFEGQPPPTGLSKVEREAATFLGYTAEEWGRCEGVSECIDRMARLEKQMAEWGTWSNMPTGVRTRLQVLGWTADLWGSGEPPALYRRSWDALRFPERVAAGLLGYNKDVWEGCVQSSCLVRYNYVIAKYEGMKWSELSLAQQNAWTMLEHSETLWSAGGMMKTRMFSYRWDELSPAQQRQAAFLGHNKGTWQGCNYDWGTSLNVTQEPSDFGGPYRTVRGRMVIQAPFSSISGNVYGNQVSTLPVSFIEVFERSVGRALFCGNPEFKEYTNGAYGPDGNPICMLPEDFERNYRRIHVVLVLEGSIIVDFVIVKNQTASEPSALFLFQSLKTQLESFQSPICQDVEFGRFARLATLTEVPLSDLNPEERNRALVFEQARARYSAANACELSRDARRGSGCPSVAATPSSALPSALLLALIVAVSALPETCHRPAA